MSDCACGMQHGNREKLLMMSLTSWTLDHTPPQISWSARCPYSCGSGALARGSGAGSTCQAVQAGERSGSGSLSSPPGGQVSVISPYHHISYHRTLLNKMEMILRRLSPNSSRGTACSGLVLAMLASLDPRKMTTISIFPMSSCEQSL